MALVPYENLPCGVCKKPLSFDSDTSMFVCELNHEFTPAEALPKVAETPAPAMELPPAFEVPPVMPLVVGAAERLSGIAESVDQPYTMPYGGISRVEAGDTRDEINDAIKRNVEMVQEALHPSAAVAVAEEPDPIGGAHEVLSVAELPGGDVIIPVRVAERHVQACKAMAESLGMKFEEFFQQEVTRFLDADWFGR